MLAKKSVLLSLTVSLLILIYCYYKEFVSSSYSLYHTVYKFPKIRPYWNSVSNYSLKFSTTRELTLKESIAKDNQVWMKQTEAKYLKGIENIKRVCRKYKIDISSKIPLKSLMIDPNHHLASCTNAKVGSTTWFHYFDMLLPKTEQIWTEGRLGAKKRTKLMRKFSGNKIFGYKDKHRWIDRASYEEFARDNNLTTFTFVRHPFERIVSAYNDKIITQKKYREFEYKSFSDFIERRVLRELESEKKWKVDLHWKPFIDRCHHCSIPYTVIGRIETFQEDFVYIILKNNLEKDLDLNNGSLFHSPNSSNKDTKKETFQYFLQLNISQIQRLYNAYKIDFELFGYDIDVYQNHS